MISAAALESLSPEEAAAAEEGLAKIAAMDDLINSGAESVSNPESALMVTNAIASILGSDDGNSTQSTVGIEVATKAIDATEVRRNFSNQNIQELFQNVVDALLNMDVATPSELTPAMTSVAATVGTILDLMLGGSTGDSGGNKTDNATETEVDPCASLSIIDKVFNECIIKSQ